MDQTIFIFTQNTQDLIEGNNNLFNMDYLLCLDQGAQCFPQYIYIFICLTREYLFIMQTNKLKEILVCL